MVEAGFRAKAAVVAKLSGGAGEQRQELFHGGDFFDAGEFAGVAPDEGFEVLSRPFGAPVGFRPQHGFRVTAREHALNQPGAEVQRLGFGGAVCEQRLDPGVLAASVDFTVGQGRKHQRLHAADERVGDFGQGHEIG